MKISETSLKERIKNLAKEKSSSVDELFKKIYLEPLFTRLTQAKEF